jgi:hypothetical protein
MVKAILFTQCLQKDFVKPIGKYEPLPNILHVGYNILTFSPHFSLNSLKDIKESCDLVFLIT